MHALMVRIKRAHLRALAAARPFSRRMGLTPARYDFMHAIVVFRVEPPQHLLWRIFGISRTSASKMVRRLMELGLVERRRAPYDRRTFIVSLTEKGAKRWKRTYLALARKRPFERRFERAFGDRSWKTFRAVDSLTTNLIRVAHHLGDTALTLYPTRPLRIGPLRLRPRPTPVSVMSPHRRIERAREREREHARARHRERNRLRPLSRTRPAPAALRHTG